MHLQIQTHWIHSIEYTAESTINEYYEPLKIFINKITIITNYYLPDCWHWLNWLYLSSIPEYVISKMVARMV